MKMELDNWCKNMERLSIDLQKIIKEFVDHVLKFYFPSCNLCKYGITIS